MKKVVISIVATIVVLFILAQTGLLAPFGIKQLSFTRENAESDGAETSNEEYLDSANDLSYRFKAEGNYFSVYRNGSWNELFMTGVNIGASEPSLFPGDLTISYETYMRWFKYISEMNCNCIRVYTTMRPQFYLALNDFNSKADNPLYLFQGIWVNEDDTERLSDVYAENEKILTDMERISDVCSNVGLAVVVRTEDRSIQPHDYVAYLHEGNAEWYNTAYRTARDLYFKKLEGTASDA